MHVGNSEWQDQIVRMRRQSRTLLCAYDLRYFSWTAHHWWWHSITSLNYSLKLMRRNVNNVPSNRCDHPRCLFRARVVCMKKHSWVSKMCLLKILNRLCECPHMSVGTFSDVKAHITLDRSRTSFQLQSNLLSHHHAWAICMCKIINNICKNHSSSVLSALASRAKGTGTDLWRRPGNFGVRTSCPSCPLQKRHENGALSFWTGR